MTVEIRPRVLLVDDNAVLLELAAEILSHACEVVGTARSGSAALDGVAVLCPDVLVIDISMPGMTGFEVVTRLRRAGNRVPVVFLSVHDDADFVRAAEAAGVVGYVAKPWLTNDLVPAVLAAHAGERFVSPARRQPPSSRD